MTTSNFLKNIDINKPGFQAPGFSWDEYIKYRPIYPKSFYDRIYNYHGSHSTSWAVAHDTGAGAGIVAEALAKQFEHVHVSDPSPKYVEIAKNRLAFLGFPDSKFSFHVEGAEKSSVESSSLDLLIIAEAIHWCDIPVAMKEFARQLKKGGTVAVTIYAPPIFDGNPEACRIWHAIKQRYLHELIALGGGIFKRWADSSAHGFDTVPFDTEYYEPGAKRIFINMGGDYDLFNMVPSPQGPNRTLPTDERVFIENDEDWIKEVDLEYCRNVCKSFMTSMKDDEFDKVWPELKTALNKQGEKCKLISPNLQLLATRA